MMTMGGLAPEILSGVLEEPLYFSPSVVFRSGGCIGRAATAAPMLEW